MKVLITGSSGFLGASLINRFLEDGHEVVAIARTKPKAAGERGGLEFCQADITDKKSLEICKEQVTHIDTIVHLAALVPKTKAEDEPEAMLKINVQGTINLLEVFGESIDAYVYASTAEVYGLPSAEGPIAETLTPAPLSYYGASKLAGEYFCNTYASKHNLGMTILRFTVLYGPGDTINRAVPNFIRKALAGEDLDVFGGEELRDYLHVSDAVEALYLAATTNAQGVFNIGTGQGITIRQVAESIIGKINPDLKMNVQEREKKAADIVLDISKARQQLKFQPKHFFPDLLEEQIEWQKKN